MVLPVAAAALSGCVAPTHATKHAFLLLGQSNMAGFPKAHPGDYSNDTRIEVLGFDNCSATGRVEDQWATANPPLHECWVGAIGPGDYFSKSLIDSLPSGDTILLVPLAVSGSKIEPFLKNGGEKWPWIMERAKLAQRAGGIIHGLLFHQGESNSGDPTWPGKVQTFVHDLRQDLELGDVPFLAGELLYSGPCAGHNKLVAQLPAMIPNAHVVSAKGLVLDPADTHWHLHFGHDSQVTFGKRYEAVYTAARKASSERQPTSAQATCPLPATFNWVSTGAPLAEPQHGWLAMKDASHVFVNNSHLVYYTTHDERNWGAGMMAFSNWTTGSHSARTAMQTPTAFGVAPTLFYFLPKRVWVLCYQWGQHKFSYRTSADPFNPNGWSAENSLYNTDFPRSGTGPIDQTVICDDRCATSALRVQRLHCFSRPSHAFSLNSVCLAMRQHMLPVLRGRQRPRICVVHGNRLLSFRVPSCQGQWDSRDDEYTL